MRCIEPWGIWTTIEIPRRRKVCIPRESGGESRFNFARCMSEPNLHVKVWARDMGKLSHVGPLWPPMNEITLEDVSIVEQPRESMVAPTTPGPYSVVLSTFEPHQGAGQGLRNRKAQTPANISHVEATPAVARPFCARDGPTNVMAALRFCIPDRTFSGPMQQTGGLGASNCQRGLG